MVCFSGRVTAWLVLGGIAWSGMARDGRGEGRGAESYPHGLW